MTFGTQGALTPPEIVSMQVIVWIQVIESLNAKVIEKLQCFSWQKWLVKYVVLIWPHPSAAEIGFVT